MDAGPAGAAPAGEVGSRAASWIGCLSETGELPLKLVTRVG